LTDILKTMERPDGPTLDVQDSINVMLPTLYISFQRKGDASSAISSVEKSISALKEFTTAFSKLPRSSTRRMQDRSSVVYPVAEIDDEPSYIVRREEHESYDALLLALADDLHHERHRIIKEKERGCPR